jgi:hypothetical protein
MPHRETLLLLYKHHMVNAVWGSYRSFVENHTEHATYYDMLAK